MEHQRSHSKFVWRYGDGGEIVYYGEVNEDWNIYVKDYRGNLSLAGDNELWRTMAWLAGRRGAAQLMQDYVKVWRSAGVRPLERVCLEIRGLMNYGPDSLVVEQLLTQLYLRAIAEEARPGRPLGKRLQRLVAHRILVEGMDWKAALESTKRVPWRELAEQCRALGF